MNARLKTRCAITSVKSIIRDHRCEYRRQSRSQKARHLREEVPLVGKALLDKNWIRWGKRCIVNRAQSEDGDVFEDMVVESAEDSAVFALGDQKLDSWVKFSVLLSTVLAALFVVWINPGTGLGGAYIETVAQLSDNTQVVMLALIVLFGIVHSGLAALRPIGEKFIGKRAYRVIFALVSLPLAAATILYFINHRYSGIQLWQLQGIPGLHTLVWILSFISFIFLYPSTFNLLEVAAVDVPELHLWETGIIRISRHPQMVGQVIWCIAHTLWIGNSFMVVASLALCVYHFFGCWHGDKRLNDKFGQDFQRIKDRTSIWPFIAIIEGRQKLPKDYWKEFARTPYLSIILFTVGAYYSHPLMQGAAYWLNW